MNLRERCPWQNEECRPVAFGIAVVELKVAEIMCLTLRESTLNCSQRKSPPDKHTEDSVRNDNESKDSSKTEEDSKQKEERCRTKEEKSKTKDEGENGNPSSPTLASRLGSLTMTSTNDDFIMVDLKSRPAELALYTLLRISSKHRLPAPPKRASSANSTGSGRAPLPLQTFVDIPPLEDLDLTKQLEIFESDLKQYDTFLQSLCQSPNNN
ncbi:hypothetical protein NQ317_012761 [Molorchus minor]|uniref:Uncharacterized protein n=1 Tax=Molorchus minor TaxID=1323400 RepID=A0ABQ9K3B5_9CUCU|nr:hypothetical protein NQ317_012761 [Molorchus minor]